MRKVLFAALSLISVSASPSQSLKTHNVVIEVNVPGSMAFQTVLGNVANLRKALAPDSVQVEIVCEGSAIEMLLDGTGQLARRIAKAHAAGTNFAACGNSLRGRHIDKKRLLPIVQVVDAGVAEVVRKQEAGWAYLKGAY